MSSNNYQVKYLKYKTKYLNLLKELYNKEGGSSTSILDKAKQQNESLHPTAGVTSAINGKLGLAKAVLDGTAGDGELCEVNYDCPEGSICEEGNCEIKPPVKFVKREKTEAEKRYDSQIAALRDVAKSK